MEKEKKFVKKFEFFPKKISDLKNIRNYKLASKKKREDLLQKAYIV